MPHASLARILMISIIGFAGCSDHETARGQGALTYFEAGQPIALEIEEVAVRPGEL